MIKNKDSRFFFLWKEKWVWGLSAVLFFLVGFFIARNSSDEIKSLKRTQILLGTVVEIQVRSTDEKRAEDAVTNAFAEIKRIDDLFTTYNEESPVHRLNSSRDSILSVEPEIYELMVICDSVTELSEGDFDVSLDNLTKIWGFYSDNPGVPDQGAIDSALLLSGWNKIELVGDNKIIRQNKVGLNFGAIAKGYAVDKAVEVLRKNGLRSALVNAGGEISVIGNDWIVGIQHPRDAGSLIKKIRLKEYTVATSGDYEQYFEFEEKRYHHILDPATGCPSAGLQSVTVMNRSNTFADALATAVFVMGRERGMKMIESLADTEAMIIDGEGSIFYSGGFEKFLIE